MATLKQAKAEAQKFGGTIEVDDYDPYDQSTLIEALAPDGMKWLDGGCQILTARKYSYDKGSASEAYEDLISRMKLGTEPLTEDEL